jgi:hypothetical protein
MRQALIKNLDFPNQFTGEVTNKFRSVLFQQEVNILLILKYKFRQFNFCFYLGISPEVTNTVIYE